MTGAPVGTELERLRARAELELARRNGRAGVSEFLDLLPAAIASAHARGAPVRFLVGELGADLELAEARRRLLEALGVELEPARGP